MKWSQVIDFIEEINRKSAQTINTTIKIRFDCF